MNLLRPSRHSILRLCVIALAVHMGAASFAANPSARARERANNNARFNRDTETARTISDDDFIRDAYARSVLESKLAHAAVENSQDKDVQTIGHRIINEQGRAAEELKKLAQTKNITLENQLGSADQQTYERLSKLNGAEFDRAYRDHLKNDYKQTIQMYEASAKNGRDAQVRDVASRYAALFEEHAQVIGITGLDSASSADRSYVRESQSTTKTSGPLSQKDQQLLNRIYRASRTETEAAQLAAKNSRDKEIQSLAQTMLTEHKQMDQELREIASRRGVTLPRQLAEGQEARVEKLGKLSGNEFDKEYHEYLAQSHKNALDMLNEGAASSDPDLRDFATKYRSAIQQHLRAVQRTGDGSNK